VYTVTDVDGDPLTNTLMTKWSISGESLFSMASFRFCATQYCVLHFTTRVFGHSAISPFLGGYGSESLDWFFLYMYIYIDIHIYINIVDLGNAEWHNIVRKKREYISWIVYVALFH